MKLKYEYLLKTWGGFYQLPKNPFKPGDYYFDSEEERRKYIEKLELKNTELEYSGMVLYKEEGYNVRHFPTLHRISSHKGELKHTTWEHFQNITAHTAEYSIENKWYPGHNDYPFGEDFDYDSPDFKIEEEWIEGKFIIES